MCGEWMRKKLYSEGEEKVGSSYEVVVGYGSEPIGVKSDQYFLCL